MTSAEIDGTSTILSRPPRHHCVVRDDLPVGLQGAWFIHAAGETGPVEDPVNTYACGRAGRAAGADPGGRRGGALEKRGIACKLVRETAGDHPGEVMALGVNPTPDNRVRKILHRFRMFGDPTEP